ncbi:MAG: radical SAM protein [Gammaproteobacteria bacterium]|nr:radical SAM protein [Gammaproteobacteria bacterium]MDH5653211.1 radical SAM protein [Gammaproteobacteria bacterium]
MPRVYASRYNTLIPLLNDRMLAYNSASGGFALWEADEYLRFNELSQGETDVDHQSIEDFLMGGYLVDTAIDEFELLRQEYHGHRANPNAVILTIAPTLACNFACDYCFQGQDKPDETISEDVAEALFDHARRTVPEQGHLHVAWYGGEPLVRIKRIEQLAREFQAICAEKQAHFDSMVVTNGYKLDVAMVQRLQKLNVNLIQVTLDGDAGHHDKMRYLLSGAATFNRIFNNLKAIAAANLGVRILIRVNIDVRNAEGIHKLIDRLADNGIGKQNNIDIYFAQVEASTPGCHSSASKCLSRHDFSDLELRLIYHAWRRNLSNLPYPPRMLGLCGAVKDKSIVVLPNGDLHKCWDTVMSGGHRTGSLLEPASAEDENNLQRWAAWSPFDNQACQHCSTLPICAGYCPYKFIYPNETLGEAAGLPCPTWKYSLKDRLIWQAMASGVITEADLPAGMGQDQQHIIPVAHTRPVAKEGCQ